MATVKKTTPKAPTKIGFAPGTRPGAISVAGKGKILVKDGRVVGQYKTPEEAQAALKTYTSPATGGSIRNIQQSTKGEITQQLKFGKTPTTTGGEQIAIAKAIQSRGGVAIYDDKGNIIGSRSQKQIAAEDKKLKGVGQQERITGERAPAILSEKAFRERQAQLGAAREREATIKAGKPQGEFIAPIGEAYQKPAPVLREQGREQEVLTRIAQERGIDPKTASTSSMQLLNEAVNTEIYGSGTPTFGEGANVLTQSQKAQEMAIAMNRTSMREQLAPTGPVVTSDAAQSLVDDQIARLEQGMAASTANFGEAVDAMYPMADAQDPDLIAEAEASGQDAQALLNERRQFLMDQYEGMTDRIKEIYQGKEEDYREQAKVSMAQSVATLARMGALGTTSAGVQYIDDQDRNDRAKLMAFAAEEAAAQQTAYEAFQSADFDLAEKMITTARQTRLDVQDMKDKVLSRQVQIENLKSMRAETASKTVDNLAKAGYSAEDLPQGYLSSLDRQMGYPAGVSAGLLDVAQKEQQELDVDAQIKQGVDMANLIKNMEVGGPPVTVGESSYSLLNYGNAITGTESGGTGTYLWTVNETTGQTAVRKIGPPTTQKYTDTTSNEGAIVRVYEDGTNKLVFDPRQPNGGYATGGLIDAFPQDSVTPFTRPNDPNKDRASECGAWVNDVTGMRLGDTFSQKLGLMDPTLAVENAQAGDVFLTQAGNTGHVGIINGKSVVNGELIFTVSESNWVKDPLNPKVGLITHERQVKASEIAGLSRPGFSDPSYNFGTDANAGPFAGLTFGEIPKVEKAPTPPTSYQEWSLAGEPGTYQEWLTKKSDKPPTADESKNAGFAIRMKDSNSTIERLEEDIQKLSLTQHQAERLKPSWLKSDTFQLVDQAERDFINSVLRRESGAAIAPSEFDNAKKQYFLQPGEEDNKALVDQKRKNRKLALQGVVLSSGNALSEDFYPTETEKPKTEDEGINRIKSMFPDIAGVVDGFVEQGSSYEEILAALQEEGYYGPF